MLKSLTDMETDDPLDALGDHYVIAGASNITKASGIGTMKMLHSDAVTTCNFMNRKWPEISHTVLPYVKVEYGRIVKRD